jgi:putative DNA primase/helicase
LVDGKGHACRVTKGTVSNVANALAADLLVPHTTDQPAWVAGPERHGNYIALQNGILNIETLSLVNATPNWFSAVCLPYDYDAKAGCPMWLAFLDRVLEKDAERIALLQEFMGLLITPDSSFHKFLVMEGEGANGKSVALEIVEAMVGSANASHVPLEVFGDRFQLTMTLNKLVNIAPEVNENIRINEGVVKQFVGGDRMYFDKKGIEGTDAKPSARLMVATNNRPPINDKSDGLWRRMLYLPFNVTIPTTEQDTQLAAKLKHELAGILNWALEGRKRLYARGRFEMPKLSEAGLQEYRKESNPAGIFLREHCEFTGAGAQVHCDLLYATYKSWAKDNGHTPLDSGQFGKALKKLFPSVEKKRLKLPGGDRPYAYAGLAFTAAVAEMEEVA